MVKRILKWFKGLPKTRDHLLVQEPKETPRQWATRVSLDLLRPPLSHEFEKYTKFCKIQIKRKPSEQTDKEMRLYCLSLLREEFNNQDWFDSGDGFIWFIDDHTAMTFKLHWHW